ncbi:hypothetical protein ACFSYG_11905 [Leeuwenhoekiella polynyae]|uniref:Uncharacterized protein n=1 Tax=Leeuwenhoekiella polynyae TaxID=1550906 RepID=A0A4Q0PFG1_9FLAO|nr:hypothetical protein [Leeuwenhoekiella polynyae]RXG25700.1 hypothetical protein DSM02_867 [Leeuwenhoekiella polynyae]
MAKTVTVKASNPISEDQRAKKLQYLQDNLTDEELDKLHQLAEKPKARKALVTKFNLIKNFL